MSNFLRCAEEYIARHSPEKNLEEIMVEMETVLSEHKKFKSYLRKNKITFDMPKKSDNTLERRRVFINWYIEKYQNKKKLNEIVSDLELLVFASRNTIYNTIYEYRKVTTIE